MHFVYTTSNVFIYLLIIYELLWALSGYIRILCIYTIFHAIKKNTTPNELLQSWLFLYKSILNELPKLFKSSLLVSGPKLVILVNETSCNAVKSFSVYPFLKFWLIPEMTSRHFQDGMVVFVDNCVIWSHISHVFGACGLVNPRQSVRGVNLSTINY